MPSTLLRPPYLAQQPIIIILLYLCLLLFNLVGFLPTKHGYDVSRAAHNFGAAYAIVVPTVIIMQLYWSPKLRYMQIRYFERGRTPSFLHSILSVLTACGTCIYCCSPWRCPGDEYSDNGQEIELQCFPKMREAPLQDAPEPVAL